MRYPGDLAVDVKPEVALAWNITKATASDGATIPDLLGGIDRVLPQRRMQTLAYDKAADYGKVTGARTPPPQPTSSRFPVLETSLRALFALADPLLGFTRSSPPTLHRLT